MLPVVCPIQKLLASEKFPINTFPEAAPTQNLVPLWFQAASILAFVSFTIANYGLSPLISLLSSQTMTPLSVELDSRRLVNGCQSNELTGFKCYKHN